MEQKDTIWCQGFSVLDNQLLGNKQLDMFDLGLLWLMAAQKEGWKFHYYWLEDKTGVGKEKLANSIKRLNNAGLVQTVTESPGRRMISRYILLNRDKVVYSTPKTTVQTPSVYNEDESGCPF